MVVVAAVQVLAPYNNTSFTMMLKTQILVLIKISEDCQMFLIYTKAVIDLVVRILPSLFIVLHM